MYPPQRIINSIFDQKQFESDVDYGVSSNSPPREYLTKILNNLFNSLLPHGESNCLINGLDVDVVSINKELNTINFVIRPGMAIVDSRLVIQKDNYEFTISYDFLEDEDVLKIKYLVFTLIVDNTTEQYKIIPFFINNDSTVLNEDSVAWTDSLFPIQVLGFETIVNVLYNTLYPNRKYFLSDNEENILNEYELILSMYKLPNISHYATNNNRYKFVHNSYSYPQKFTFNNQEYIVPMYSSLEMLYYNFINSSYISDNLLFQ